MTFPGCLSRRRHLRMISVGICMMFGGGLSTRLHLRVRKGGSGMLPLVRAFFFDPQGRVVLLPRYCLRLQRRLGIPSSKAGSRSVRLSHATTSLTPSSQKRAHTSLRGHLTASLKYVWTRQQRSFFIKWRKVSSPMTPARSGKILTLLWGSPRSQGSGSPLCSQRWGVGAKKHSKACRMSSLM